MMTRRTRRGQGGDGAKTMRAEAGFELPPWGRLARRGCTRIEPTSDGADAQYDEASSRSACRSRS